MSIFSSTTKASTWRRWIYDRVVTNVQLTTTTTAALDAVGNAINTSDNKIAGSAAYNTTTDNPVYAVGPAAADIWVDGAGTTVHSPA